MDAVTGCLQSYSYILDVNSVIVSPPGDDVASLDLKELEY